MVVIMNIYLEKRKQLPKSLQEYLDTQQPYIDDQAVFLAYGLNDQQKGDVAKYIGQAFVGMIPIDQFQKNLSTVLGDESLASGVAAAVLRKSFLRFPQHFPQATALENQWKALGKQPSIPLEEAEKKFITENPWVLIKDEPEDITSRKAKTAQKPAKIDKLPLLKAMSEYDRLGEQQVTTEKIKIKNQSELQRPTLANWIRYYRDELGIGFHDQVLRGRFLFQSENGKKLNNEERERINLILKSIEEDFPIDIDTDRQVVVFPARTATPAPVSQVVFPHREPAVPPRETKPFKPVPPPAVSPAPAKPSFFTSTLSPAKNVAGDTLHFSTGHVLPGEKDSEGSAAKAASPQPTTAFTSPQPPRPSLPTTPPIPITPTPAFMSGINRSRGPVLPRSPYSIRPLRMQEGVRNQSEENA